MTPLEPLYTLKQAAAIIPYRTADLLREWLYRHRDALKVSRYTRVGYRRIRLLTLTELRLIRGMVVKEVVLAPLPTSPRHRVKPLKPSARP